MSSFEGPEVAAAPAAAANAPRPGAVQPGLAVLVVSSTGGFDALEREWNALHDRCDTTVFQSFEWQRTWWRHFGERREDARLHIVTVRGREGLVAIAPLYVERARVLGALRLRRLLFVGHRDSDYLDVLVARGREAECVEIIAAHLAAAQGDLFDMALLEETPDSSRAGPLLYGALRARGWAATRERAELCPRTPLRPTWEETLASLPINYRREMRRRVRNLEKSFETEMELATGGEGVEPAVSEFIEMHQDRWTRDGYWGAFAERASGEFQREVAQRLSRRGWLFLAFLRVGGERVAVNYAFRFRGTVYIYLTGARHRPDLRAYSPGRSLHILCMKWAVEHGWTVYDFMRGTEHYKYELGAVDAANFTIVAYPRNPGLTAAKHRVEVLLRGVARRSRRELKLAVAAARRDGWFSMALLNHLARGSRRAARDFLRRVSPRRSDVGARRS